MERWMWVAALIVWSLASVSAAVIPEFTPDLQDSRACEVDAPDPYEEECNGEVVSLWPCNAGERRVWRCDPAGNSPTPPNSHSDMCNNCPRHTFRDNYNKCPSCLPCSQCQAGEVEKEPCMADQDIVCEPDGGSTGTTTPPPSTTGAVVDTSTTTTTTTTTPTTTTTTTPTPKPTTQLSPSPTPATPPRPSTTATSSEPGTQGTTEPQTRPPGVESVGSAWGTLYIVLIIVVIILVILVVVMTLLFMKEYLSHRHTREQLRDFVKHFQLQPSNGNIQHSPLPETPSCSSYSGADNRLQGLRGDGADVNQQDLHVDGGGDRDGHHPEEEDPLLQVRVERPFSAEVPERNEQQMSPSSAEYPLGGQTPTTRKEPVYAKVRKMPRPWSTPNGVGGAGGSGFTYRPVDGVPGSDSIEMTDLNFAAPPIHCASALPNTHEGRGSIQATSDAHPANGATEDRGAHPASIIPNVPSYSRTHGASPPADDSLVDESIGADASPSSDPLPREGSGIDGTTDSNSSSGTHPTSGAHHQNFGTSAPGGVDANDSSAVPGGNTHAVAGILPPTGPDSGTTTTATAMATSNGSIDPEEEPIGSVSNPRGNDPVHDPSSTGAESPAASGTLGGQRPQEASNNQSTSGPGSNSVSPITHDASLGASGADDGRNVSAAIKPDDVVGIPFLQHAAHQELTVAQVKKLCRLLSLKEKYIDDIEASTPIMEERSFQLLKKLLSQRGRDLTHRLLRDTLIKAGNKHSSDNLIAEFQIQFES